MAEAKVALITAGDSAMGADSANALAAEGFEVGIRFSSGKGEALAKALGGLGSPAPINPKRIFRNAAMLQCRNGGAWMAALHGPSKGRETNHSNQKPTNKGDDR